MDQIERYKSHNLCPEMLLKKHDSPWDPEVIASAICIAWL